MLSRFIINSFGVLVEIALWGSLIASLGAGYTASGIMGLVGGFIVWLIAAVIIFGVMLIMKDIQSNVSRIRSLQEDSKN